MFPYIAIGTVVVWLAYELFAWATGRKLITTYFREWAAISPMFPAGVGLLIGVLLGHFFWWQ